MNMRLFKNLRIKKSTLLSVLLSFLLFSLFSGAALAGAKLEIGLPGMSKGTEIANPAVYLRNIFIISYSLIGFLAVAIIVWGGILYSIPGKTSQAKQMILGAISGVVLLFCSYLILATIDPTLTQLLPGNLQNLEPITINPPEEYVTPPKLEEAAGVSPEPIAPLSKLQCLGGLTNAYICDDLNGSNSNLRQTLIDNLKNLPVSAVITETTRNHGCSSTDSCTAGAACGTSDHCKGTAVDIRISDQTSKDIEKIMESLSKSSCVSDLFYAGFPGYCKNNGGTARQDSQSACMTHKSHIHYSVNSLCK